MSTNDHPSTKPSIQRPPSACSTNSTTRLNASSTSNSIVLEQILQQLDQQETNIKSQAAHNRTIVKCKETIAKHEQDIVQLQATVSNLLQQQTMLMTFINGNNTNTNTNNIQNCPLIGQNTPQQQNILIVQSPRNSGIDTSSDDSTALVMSPPTLALSPQSATQRELDLMNKLHAKEDEVITLTKQAQEHIHSIQVLTKGYNQKSVENETLQKELTALKHEIQSIKTEHSLCLEKQSNSTDVIKVKYAHDSIETQINHLEKNKNNNLETQNASRDAIQLFVKALSGKAILVNANVTDTVSLVKTRIADDIKVPIREQILIDEKTGKELPNEKSLLELNVLNHTVLHLVIKNRAL